MSVLALALSVALAQAPLDVTVERPPTRPPAKVDPPWVGALEVGRGPIVVDGVLDDDAWDGASSPSFVPFVDGGAVPVIHARAVWADEGLAVAVAGLAPDRVAKVLIHPDGLNARWWIATLTTTEVTWLVCDYGGVWLPVERAALPDAAPCVSVEGLPSAGREGNWEILLPESAGATYTTLGRLDLVVTGPRASGGRWGPGGREPQPTSGLLLAPDAPPVTVSATVDLEADRVRADVTVPPGVPAWRWRLVYRDLVLGEGPLAVEGTTGRLETDLPRLERLGFVVEAAEGPAPRLAGLRWLASEYTSALATPVFGDHVAIAVRTSAFVADAPIEVAGPDGVVLGTAKVLLPTGPSMVRIAIPPEWPDTLRVRVGTVADVTALRGAP